MLNTPASLKYKHSVDMLTQGAKAPLAYITFCSSRLFQKLHLFQTNYALVLVK